MVLVLKPKTPAGGSVLPNTFQPHRPFTGAQFFANTANMRPTLSTGAHSSLRTIPGTFLPQNLLELFSFGAQQVGICSWQLSGVCLIWLLCECLLVQIESE